MATKIGPKTVTQRDRSKNLVFCVDAAHPDSYGGEPTTNSVGSNASAYTSNDATATYTDAPEKGPDWKKITITARGSNFRISRWGYITADAAGNKVTMSVEYEFAAGNSAGYYWTLDGSGGHTVSSAYTENNKKQSYTAYSGTGASKVIAIFLYNYSTGVTGLNDVIYYRYYQAEQKDHSTPYTATSRTATTAINNISGVGAQGTDWIQGSAADTYGQELAYHSDGYSPGTQDGRSVAKTRKVLRTRESNKGHIGGAYWDFDGSDETIDCGDIDALEIQYMTIAAWINPDATTADDYVMSTKQAGGFSMGINIASMAANKISTRSYAAGAYNNLAGTSDIPIGEWTYVVTTYDGSNFRIYVNGEQENSSAVAGTLDYTAGNLFIGAESGGAVPGGGYFNGKIATAMIWSVALTAKEIKDIYIAQKGRFGK